MKVRVMVTGMMLKKKIIFLFCIGAVLSEHIDLLSDLLYARFIED